MSEYNNGGHILNKHPSMPELREKRDLLYELEKILAIFIACMGLFGLASFTEERRTKEIDIRKVMGASIPGIVMLLSREFVILLIAANIIAWPVSYYVMNR